MEGLVIVVAVTALVGVVLWYFDRRNHTQIPSESPSDAAEENGGAESESEADEENQQCCGMHIVCEKTYLSPLSDEIVYYEDEELDRFRGREADSYNDMEIEEWRDVLLTLRPSEIAGWARSVQLRRLTMPSAIRDELLMIVAEARASL